MEAGALIKKLKQFREENNLNQVQMSDYLNIGYRTYQGIEATGIVKKPAVLAHIELKLRTKPGHQGAVSDSNENYGVPQNITIIDTQNEVKSYLQKRRDKKNAISAHMVPLVPVKARAGYAQNYDLVDYLKHLEHYPLMPGIDHRGSEWRYFEVDGDSMEPELISGDLVLASLVPSMDWAFIKDFYVYIIVTNEELLIKRLFKKTDSLWVMISDNESHPQKLLDVNTINELWVLRRHVKSRVPPPKKFEIKL